MNRLIITFFALMATVAGVALAADATAGAAIFSKSCKACHGEGGVNPNAAVSKMFGVPIPMLNSAQVQALSDADIHKVITDGKGKMPPVKTVTGASVDDVVAYVKSLKK